MEYPVMIAIVAVIVIISVVTLSCVLSRSLTKKRAGAFRIEIKIGKFAFVIDFRSGKS